jgi:hypothetical protein
MDWLMREAGDEPVLEAYSRAVIGAVAATQPSVVHVLEGLLVKTRAEIGKCYVFHPAGYDAPHHRRATAPVEGALLWVLELNADTLCIAEAIDGTIVLIMVVSLQEVR